MAKEVITLFRDDLDGAEATKTVVFAWEGTTYEIDLSDENFVKFSSAISPYLAAARKTPKPRRSRISASIAEAYDDAQAALAKTGVPPRLVQPRQKRPRRSSPPNRRPFTK